METWRSLWLRINFQSSATSVEESCKETQAAVLSGCFMHAWLLRKLRLWEIPLGHRAYFSIFALSLPHMSPPPPVILFLSHPLWLNSITANIHGLPTCARQWRGICILLITSSAIPLEDKFYAYLPEEQIGFEDKSELAIITRKEPIQGFGSLSLSSRMLPVHLTPSPGPHCNICVSSIEVSDPQGFYYILLVHTHFSSLATEKPRERMLFASAPAS